MYAAVVEPSKIAQVLGLRRKLTSIEQLDQQVEAGLPKASLGAVARHVYGTSPAAPALMQRVIPSATLMAPEYGSFAAGFPLARGGSQENTWPERQPARATGLEPTSRESKR